MYKKMFDSTADIDAIILHGVALEHFVQAQKNQFVARFRKQWKNTNALVYLVAKSTYVIMCTFPSHTPNLLQSAPPHTPKPFHTFECFTTFSNPSSSKSFPSCLSMTSTGGARWPNNSVQTPSGTRPSCNTCANWLGNKFAALTLWM